MVDLLDVNRKDSEGNTPLHIAIKKHRKTLLDMLFEQPDVDVLSLNNNGESVLHLCARDPRVQESTLGK